VEAWLLRGAPKHVIDIITGYKLNLVQPPVLLPTNAMPRNLLTPVSDSMDKCMSDFEIWQAIGPAQPSPSCIYKFFTIKKPDGSDRNIFNLKPFNKLYLDPPRFHLPNIVKIKSFLKPNDYMISLDLKNAYLHIPMHPDTFKFLRFIYRERLMEMRVLPFGLSPAPRVFTIVGTWMIDYLRSKGLNGVSYIDDFLFSHNNALRLRRQSVFAINEFYELGWYVSLAKSDLEPSQVAQFIGVIFDTVRDRCFLPDKKVQALRDLILLYVRSRLWSRKLLEKFCGMLAFASQIVPLGRLHSRLFQLELNSISRTLDYVPRSIPDSLIPDILWWHEHVTDHGTIFPLVPNAFCVADASDWGCSCVINGVNYVTQWRDYQKDWHINSKELFAITHFVTLNINSLSGSILQIQTDNTTAQAYLANQGGTHSRVLYDHVRPFLLLLHEHNIRILPVRIPSIYNCLADALSRGQLPPEWHLLPPAVFQIAAVWGHPSLDLFASRYAHVCPRYVSNDASDPSAVWVNAFARPWQSELFWTFPPPHLIPQVLQQLQLGDSHGTFVLITPFWVKAFWYHNLQRLSREPPIGLLNLPLVLRDCRTGQPPVDVAKMELVAWRICL